jgi:hypothetical protein
MSDWNSDTALAALTGGLWHTTTPDRFQTIMKTGAILPEPDIPENQRLSTAQGPDGWHLTRKLGAVSLFDFANFDPAEYEKKCPISNWYYFVPFRKEIGAAIWIEIDRFKLTKSFISGTELLNIWKDGHLRHRLMPYIEAAHIGPLSISIFRRVLLADKNNSSWQEIHGSSLESRP